MPEQTPKSYIRMKRIPDSSNVRSAGYSKRNQELAVRYKSTPQRYFYSDVPYTVYKELMEAPSKGKYLYQNVKGYYPYVKDNYTGDEFAQEETMPAKSQAQQRYFGWLYSKKKSGDTSGLSDKDKKTMNDMSKDQIRDYAATKRKGLPTIIKKEVEKKAYSYQSSGQYTISSSGKKDWKRLSKQVRSNKNFPGMFVHNSIFPPREVAHKYFDPKKYDIEYGDNGTWIKPKTIEKKSGLLNFAGKAAGYHDINRLSKMTGVDKNRVYNMYHTYRFPNSMLYSYEDAAKDIGELDKLWSTYDTARAPLLKTRPNSAEEAEFLKVNQKTLDALAESIDTYAKGLNSKYTKIKGGEQMPKTASLMDTLKSIGQNQFIKHVGGGALMGIPLGAAYYGAMGSEHTPLKDRMLDGAERGAIGGAALGTLYHIGRKYYGMPRFKDLVSNRVPRY